MAGVSLDAQGGNVQSHSDFPAHNAVAVTPSDSTIQKYRSVWVGTSGNLAVVPLNGDAAVTFVSCSNAQLVPIAVQKVMSTNTTASNIVGLI